MSFIGCHIGIRNAALGRLYNKLRVNPNLFLRKVIPPSIVSTFNYRLPVDENTSLKRLRNLMMET